MNLLISGGAGFIGSNFIRFMLEKYKEYKILNLDILTYAGNLENLSDIELNPNYTFVKGDITNTQLVDYIVKHNEIDAIINFAAESHVDRSIKDPEIFVKTNVVGTQTLLDVAYKYKVKKFIQVSTDEVYGSLGEDGFFTEDTPLAPSSPYSASKAAADLLVKAYYETYKLNVNITRCSNNYGPFQNSEKLIPLIITNAMEERVLPVYGDGQNIRDWLHVVDHCMAIDLVLQKGAPGEIYNIGGNNEKLNIDVVKEIINQLGKSVKLITFVKDRKGHDRRYAIDASKITNELGWEPSYCFKEGLKTTIEWYLNNREWWGKVKN